MVIPIALMLIKDLAPCQTMLSNVLHWIAQSHGSVHRLSRTTSVLNLNVVTLHDKLYPPATAYMVQLCNKPP